jgi:hypothetical protein
MKESAIISTENKTTIKRKKWITDVTWDKILERKIIKLKILLTKDQSTKIQLKKSIHHWIKKLKNLLVGIKETLQTN